MLYFCMVQLENLDSVIDFIIENNLIAKGDKIGVGVSGGTDSMALLHFLQSIAKDAGFSVVAIHVNHNIRPNAKKDAQFVAKYCKQNGIDYIGMSVDVPTLAKQKKLSLEQAARILRYDAFEAALKKAKLSKIATGHHQSDQAETILMHIFRGSGIAGARGMDAKRGNYIRPFLDTKKSDIIAYNYRNGVPNIEDETNADNTYARNFIRNQIIPILQSEWRNVEKNIIDFGKNCQNDDEYLDSLINKDSFIVDNNIVRMPLNFFAYPNAIVNRLIIAGFECIDERENIEKKHVELISTLAKTGENGSRVDLPNNLYAVREYEYIALVKKQPPSVSKIYPFKIGKTNFAEYGTITAIKTIKWQEALGRGMMVMDVDKLPRNAKWRTRKDGDMFTKFGGGTKTLAAYMIDKKIPARLRDRIPVLATDNEIYAIAGIEISDKVKTNNRTLEGHVIEITLDK